MSFSVAHKKINVLCYLNYLIFASYNHAAFLHRYNFCQSSQEKFIFAMAQRKRPKVGVTMSDKDLAPIGCLLYHFLLHRHIFPWITLHYPVLWPFIRYSVTDLYLLQYSRPYKNFRYLFMKELFPLISCINSTIREKKRYLGYTKPTSNTTRQRYEHLTISGALFKLYGSK